MMKKTQLELHQKNQFQENSSLDMEQSVFNNNYKDMQVRGPDRRRKDERRTDPREQAANKNVWLWFKSLFKPRAGVDRRKNERRQTIAGSTQSKHSSELTSEELDQLLG